MKNSIYKRSDERFEGRIQLGRDENGIRKYVSFFGRTREFGTEIFCDIDLPEQLNVSSFDMTVIMGNLLDNAIETLQQSEKKVLIIMIKFNKGVIRIDIENSYNSKYKRKKDGREHGIGLLSVTNTLEKYHGTLKAFPEKDKYNTTVVLFNSFD